MTLSHFFIGGGDFHWKILLTMEKCTYLEAVYIFHLWCGNFGYISNYFDGSHYIKFLYGQSIFYAYRCQKSFKQPKDVITHLLRVHQVSFIIPKHTLMIASLFLFVKVSLPHNLISSRFWFIFGVIWFWWQWIIHENIQVTTI